MLQKICGIAALLMLDLWIAALLMLDLWIAALLMLDLQACCPVDVRPVGFLPC